MYPLVSVSFSLVPKQSVLVQRRCHKIYLPPDLLNILSNLGQWFLGLLTIIRYCINNSGTTSEILLSPLFLYYSKTIFNKISASDWVYTFYCTLSMYVFYFQIDILVYFYSLHYMGARSFLPKSLHHHFFSLAMVVAVLCSLCWSVECWKPHFHPDLL